MANTMRWRYGDTNPVVLPVESEVDVEIGDLVYRDLATQTARSAASLPDQGSSVLNQSTFQDGFVGVAMQASRVGETAPIRIATSGVFEFDCDPATWRLGDLVASAVDGPGDQLIDQKVASADAIGLAVGRCAKSAPLAAPRVLVDIVSVIMRGGPQSAE